MDSFCTQRTVDGIGSFYSNSFRTNHRRHSCGSGSAFVWLKVPGAASYEIQIASDSLFSTVIVDSAKIADTTLALQEIMDSKLTGKTKYFWHVKAVSDTATSSFSIAWSFITPTLTSMKSDRGLIPK